jgi:hypothetical protein
LEFFAYQHVCRELCGEDGGIAVDFRRTEKNAPFAAFLARIACADTETFCVAG